MTGYVHQMVDKSQTFPEFALSCARAFGALIHMRDDDISVPAPEEVPPESYHADSAKEARRDLANFEAMGEAGRLAWAETYKRANVDTYRKCIAEAEEANAKLTAMMEQVKAWTPPTRDHENMKKFMLEQLQSSMNRTDFYTDQIATLQAKDAAELIQERFTSLNEDIAYHDEKYAEEVKRAAERTQWVQQLRKSLR